jgi:Na+-translocating ferredoxin:NAD+ oxidoreductase RnfC subunit
MGMLDSKTSNSQKLALIKSHGVVGAGGAGFPAGAKLSCSADIVIANGAECEPLLHKDKELVAAKPDSVIRGLAVAMELAGAQTGIIALKKKAHQAIQAVKPFLSSSIRLKLLDDIYPAGDEFVLVHEVTGRTPPAGGLPLDVKVVVQNIETLFWIGEDAPVTDKYLTIAGNVDAPATYRAPIGISIRDIMLCAGHSLSDRMILSGGALMGALITDLDLPITKTTGGIIVLPKGHPLLRRYQRIASQAHRIGKSACDQCMYCTQFCPRYLLGHPIEPHLVMRHAMMSPPGTPFPEGARYCCSCNLCSLWACPEDLDPAMLTTLARQNLISQGRKDPLPAPIPHPMGPFRKPRLAVLKRRLGLDLYIDAAPLSSMEILPKFVSIPLKQHIGVPAQPVVAIGQKIKKGDAIGVIPDGALGADVHASISGTVREIGSSVVIEGA